MNIAIIGAGYWGPNLIRNFLKNPKVEKVKCYDRDQNRIKRVQQNFPNIEIADNYTQILNDKNLNAIVVVTPLSSHFELAKAALENKKHVLMEKPMTASTDQAKELLDIAGKNDLVLMVDHTFVYNGAVRKIKELIDKKEIGDILYYDAVRINLGLFQSDINVVWDLAPHDLSIMDYLLQKKPVAVSATGMAHYGQYEDVAYVTVFFNDKCIAHIHASWLAPVKIRQILVGGSQKMIVYDDTEASEKIKVYDKGVDVTTKEGIYEMLIQYRMGDMYSPKYDTKEPLALVVDEFITSIEQGRTPLTDGEAGMTVVKILEAAERSIKNKGTIIDL